MAHVPSECDFISRSFIAVRVSMWARFGTAAVRWQQLPITVSTPTAQSQAQHMQFHFIARPGKCKQSLLCVRIWTKIKLS